METIKRASAACVWWHSHHYLGRKMYHRTHFFAAVLLVWAFSLEQSLASYSYMEKVLLPITQCQRRSLQLDMQQDLNLPFVYPRTIDIGECVGDCPNTILSRLTGRDEQACCVPTSFRSLHVLVAIEDHVTIQYLSNAIVSSCGCPSILWTIL